MVRVHTFLALLAGFAVMFAIVLAVTALLRRLAPQWVEPAQRPHPAYIFVTLAYSFLAASAGGYVTAWAAADNPLQDVLGLAIIVLVLGAISALQVLAPGAERRGRQPVWHQIMLLVISPLGVVAGGLLRLRMVGML
jgi:hypothetical protein